ncbi:MAG: FAD-dependent oxidoreductase [Gammaproteobacteria bacterium]
MTTSRVVWLMRMRSPEKVISKSSVKTVRKITNTSKYSSDHELVSRGADMFNRRSFLKIISGTAATSMVSPAMPSLVYAGSGMRTVIIGGGVAGIRTAARLQQFANSLDVTLIDPTMDLNTRKYTKINETLRYESAPVLSAAGIDVIAQKVVQVEPVSKRVQLANGASVEADVLVFAPGVDFKTTSFTRSLVHPLNEALVLRQLESMQKGGVVVVGIPRAPYQYPQGPYVQVSHMADYLRSHNRSAKILVLDHNVDSALAHVYRRQWKKGIGQRLVEWIGINEGYIHDIDFDSNTINTVGGYIRAAVIAVMPEQQAGTIARNAGLAVGTDWCQVDSQSFESVHYPDIYVLGDANDAAPNNKTAFTAMQQADDFVRIMVDKIA